MTATAQLGYLGLSGGQGGWIGSSQPAGGRCAPFGFPELGAIENEVLQSIVGGEQL